MSDKAASSSIGETEDYVDHLLGDEYERTPVPLSARYSLFSVTTVWLGFPMIITGAMTGSVLVLGMGFISTGGATMTTDYAILHAGDVTLQRGAAIRDCKLAYKTFGTLNAAKDNCIVYPTWYSGQHDENEGGHFAGGPVLPKADFDFLDGKLKELLAS